MNSELVVLRILHIVSGVFWAGAAVYLAVVLEPKLRQIGGSVERDVLQAISKLNSYWITGSAIVTILAGFALISRTPGRSFSELFSNGWGSAIGIGLIASLAAFFLSGMVGASTARLRRGLADGTASAETIAKLQGRIAMGSRVNTALVLIAVGTMAAARYV
ncbi:MAG: hypothetical protein O2788_03570 [Chloroflexi bacterium]|nr:hypothetical protein [Chloroflexota bacterium]